MELWQIGTLLIGLVFVTLLVYKTIVRFDKRLGLFLPLLILPSIFTLGFLLRLSDNSRLVDIGYYFTDISNLVLYVIFTFALLVGQKKYWKVN